MVASSCDLPQELIDHIIDHLHNDRNSLASCSRVCRSWLPRSTFHLFIKLHTHLAETGGINSSLLSFYYLPNQPRIASSIRELHITGHDMAMPLINIELLRKALPSLPHLNDLFLEAIVLDNESPRIPTPVFRPKLVSLHLLSLRQAAPIYSLIMSFEEIRSVHVVRYGAVNRASQPVAPFNIDAAYLKTRVSSLTVHTCNSQGTRLLLQQLEHCMERSALTSVTFKGYSPYASLPPSVDHFLATFANVRRLSLFISQHGVLDTNMDELADGLNFTSLASCTNLEVIYLSMPMIYHRLKIDHNLRVWSCCMNFLNSAPPTLRNLRVDVECGLQFVKMKRSTAAEYFAQLDWNQFNTVLDHLICLQKAELWLGERPWHLAARSQIEKSFSTRARRLLGDTVEGRAGLS